MPKIVDHDAQRRALSATAVQLIADAGLENTTLRRVAAAHACTKGMVQHYFDSKEALLLGAWLYVEESYRRRTEACARLEGLARLEAQLLALLPMNETLREEWCVRVAFHTRAEIAQEVRQLQADRLGQLLTDGLKWLRQAQRQGEVAQGLNLRQAMRALLVLVQGIGLSVVMDAASLPPRTQKQLLLRQLEQLREVV